MKIAQNNQEEEYREFLKKIRQERQGTSNIAKLLFTVVLAVLCAVIVCVTILKTVIFWINIQPSRLILRVDFSNLREKEEIFRFRFLPKDKIFYFWAWTLTVSVQTFGKEHALIQ